MLQKNEKLVSAKGKDDNIRSCFAGDWKLDNGKEGALLPSTVNLVTTQGRTPSPSEARNKTRIDPIIFMIPAIKHLKLAPRPHLALSFPGLRCRMLLEGD